MTDNRTLSARGCMTLTVGHDRGDLRGNDDKILQAGLDYLHRLGGGVLHVYPGVFTMRNALYMRPGVTLRGSGESTILRKAASVSSKIIRDADWYETSFDVENAAGFTVGGGVMLISRMLVAPDAKHLEHQRFTITAIDGNRITVDRRIDRDFYPSLDARAVTLFALIDGHDVHDVTLEDLVLSGARDQNEFLDGNYTGALFAEDCDRWRLYNVAARDVNGDGFSFQRCDDWRFESCISENNASLAFHPGSGSLRPLFRNCIGRYCDQGFFFCWGVNDGLVENCVFCDNRKFGVNFGHRDSDNRVIGCTIDRNGVTGVIFRKEPGEFQGAHRNTIDGCLIRDNGVDAEGVGIDILGEHHDLRITNNRFVDTGRRKQRMGIRMGTVSRNVQLAGNHFDACEPAGVGAGI